MNIVHRVLLSSLALFTTVGGVATLTTGCGSSDGSVSSNDALSKTCTDITTLTCEPGFELSEDGCAQSRVQGAHPLGRCVASSDSSACTDITTLTCESGFELSEDGCAQTGSTPQGQCVAIPTDADAGTDSACTDITTLTCEAGFVPSEDGCFQSRVEGATPQGHCVASN